MRTGTIVSVTLCVLTFLPGFGQDARPGPAGELRGGFENPPAAARPRVWWHWMNGNITKEGIRLDLEWMKRVGIGGLQNFDAALMTPKVVENRLAYMTSEWKETFRYAAGLADQFDLEMAIASSPGWSETGGPWVKPEQAMKKLVWSELRIRGGSPFAGTLPKPPTTTGPFQGVPLRNELPSLGGPTAPPPQYYADAAVVAYRLPPAAAPARPPATLTSSAGARDAARLSDGDLVEGVKIPLGPDGGWVQHTYPVPQTIHAVTLARPAAGLFMPTAPLVFRLESSSDGKTFAPVAELPAGRVAQLTFAFPPVSARCFRLKIERGPKSEGFGGFEPVPGADPGFFAALSAGGAARPRGW